MVNEVVKFLTTDQECSMSGAENPKQSVLDDNLVDDAGVLKHDIHRHLNEYGQEHETIKCCSECCMPDRKNPN